MRFYNAGYFFMACLILLCCCLAAGCTQEEKSYAPTVITNNAPAITQSAPETTPGTPQKSYCSPYYTRYVEPVPVDYSTPLTEPLPGIRYSLNQSDSGKTITLKKGETFEITLEAIPGLPYRWFMPVKGTGLELMNYGTFSEYRDPADQDYTSTIFPPGQYRQRYRAVSTGTSELDGIFAMISPCDAGYTALFNLTVNIE
jgi:predicted secreted protein